MSAKKASKIVPAEPTEEASPVNIYPMGAVIAIGTGTEKLENTGLHDWELGSPELPYDRVNLYVAETLDMALSGALEAGERAKNLFVVYIDIRRVSAAPVLIEAEVSTE
jgi:hypothetical protein